jgi:trans-2,3-dihydro-3-hydroxyanthranilate isomerase
MIENNYRRFGPNGQQLPPKVEVPRCRLGLLDSRGIVAAAGILGAFTNIAHDGKTSAYSEPQSDSKMRKERMHIPFYFVDVFAETPLTGNPLAIVPHAELLDEVTMGRIAAELNQAESTFIMPATDKSAHWRLRSFTASGYEVFGAGHNSLGAWWWLAESGELKLSDGSNRFIQEIGDTLLPVEVRCEGHQPLSVVLTQSSPQFGGVCEDLPELVGALGLEIDDLSHSLPVQVVSTGAEHLLVPVRNREAVARAHPDAQRLAKVLKAAGGEGCYLYSLDPVLPSSTAHTRFFNPTVGIVEDSATGTAAGPLACLLVSHGIVDDGSTVAIEQGYEMKRPSILHVRVQGKEVELSGRGVIVIDGRLRIE